MKEANIRMVNTAKRINFISLFTSGSTLVCCALPATLVALGSVATLTSLMSAFPQLIWISEHKGLVFGLAAFMLFVAGYYQWQARNAPCPIDPELAKACIKARRQAFYGYWISVGLFMIGTFFAFIAPLLM